MRMGSGFRVRKERGKCPVRTGTVWRTVQPLHGFGQLGETLPKYVPSYVLCMRLCTYVWTYLRMYVLRIYGPFTKCDTAFTSGRCRYPLDAISLPLSCCDFARPRFFVQPTPIHTLTHTKAPAVHSNTTALPRLNAVFTEHVSRVWIQVYSRSLSLPTDDATPSHSGSSSTTSGTRPQMEAESPRLTPRKHH